MYKRIAIIGYKSGSGSVSGLCSLLKKHINIPVLRIPKTSKTYQPRYTDYIINWGCSTEWDFITLDNKVGHMNVVNKLNFFKFVDKWNSTNKEQINIPEWTEFEDNVIKWLEDGDTVVARKILTGHSGAGIILLNGNDKVPNAPLYVKYKKKRHEYRVHFFKEDNGTYKVIDVTQKKKRKDADFVDTKIRNHKNGWVYAREGITEPADLRHQALLVAFASGLKLGAVDLIWNEKENKSYVLEINTAPGLVGTTLTKYTEAIIEDINK